MKIYLLESNHNKELNIYLKKRHVMLSKQNLHLADVIIVSKVHNIKEGLEIVDYALMEGKEIICIKNNFAREHYVCNYLIQNGAEYI